MSGLGGIKDTAIFTGWQHLSLVLREIPLGCNRRDGVQVCLLVSLLHWSFIFVLIYVKGNSTALSPHSAIITHRGTHLGRLIAVATFEVVD